MVVIRGTLLLELEKCIYMFNVGHIVWLYEAILPVVGECYVLNKMPSNLDLVQHQSANPV